MHIAYTHDAKICLLEGDYVLVYVAQARTAIGFAAGPAPIMSTYMTPSHSPGVDSYVSMGGAGFIYPEVCFDWARLFAAP